MSVVNVISHDGKVFSKTSLPIILKIIHPYISKINQKRLRGKLWVIKP